MRPSARILAVWYCALALPGVPVLAQAPRTIHGIVTSVRDTMALPDVVVRVAGGAPHFRTTTDATGRFTLDLPPTAAWVVATRAGFAPESLPADAGTFVIRLRPLAVRLEGLTVVGRSDDLIGLASSASQGHVGAADLRRRPMARVGELLEAVPGVIVTQHSGDGKANQYFIRGFNLDHGTDFQTSVEGMPVNMASHAHGQGYTDLNFLMPELVDYVDYRLGVYHAELGDFGSAGGAAIRLRRRLDRPFLGVEGGQHGLQRLGAGGSLPAGRGSLLAALAVRRYDGPWVLRQRERKYDGVVRYSWAAGVSRFSLLGMGYRNSWNATDQIPGRAVSGGLVDRFGFIDSTDGGASQRYSLSAAWERRAGGASSDAHLYLIHSALDLFSNFGYFLDDPVNGDQFSQQERRLVLGGSATHARLLGASRLEHRLRVGIQTRADFIDDVGLHRTRARVRRGTVRQDDVREWASGAFAELESRWGGWIRTVLGGRVDVTTFTVSGDRAENAGQRTAGIASPKLSLVLTPSAGTELYLSGGFGFHSNDARGTTITIDPLTGEPAEPVDPLVRSRGAEVGLRLTPRPGWRSTVSVWTLALDGELLFVGDAGITEPSAPSRRAGLTVANFYRPVARLALDADISLARARFVASRGEDRIPGAIERVVTAGVAWSPVGPGPGAVARLRHFGAYPLSEDNTVRASPTTLVTLEASYVMAGRLQVTATLLNATNARASDIQYYYASRLPGEPAEGTEDIHFHPVEPRQVRVRVSWGL